MRNLDINAMLSVLRPLMKIGTLPENKLTTLVAYSCAHYTADSSLTGKYVLHAGDPATVGELA
jgi:hypothetical protein